MKINITKKQELTIENFIGNASGRSFSGIRLRLGKNKPKTILHFHQSKAYAIIDALKECLSGIDDDSDNFYESPAWQKLRYETLKKYRKCCLCGSTGNLHVDHIKPRSLFPNLELEASNLQILCKRCNLAKSNRDAEDYR